MCHFHRVYTREETIKEMCETIDVPLAVETCPTERSILLLLSRGRKMRVI